MSHSRYLFVLYNYKEYHINDDYDFSHEINAELNGQNFFSENEKSFDKLRPISNTFYSITLMFVFSIVLYSMQS